MDHPPGGSDPPPPPEVEPPPPKEEATVLSAPPEVPGTEGTSPKLPPRSDGFTSNNAKRRRNNKRGGNAPATGRGRPGNRPKRAAPSSALQLPQMKITIRNIGDVERHGSTAKLLDMVRNLLVSVNEEASGKGGLPICLDEESVQRLIRAEELAAIEEVEQEAAAVSEEAEANPTEGERDVKTKDTESKAESTSEEAKPGYAAVTAGPQETLKAESSNVVAARVLYVVLPKRSRRRGQKNGCAYLVLSPPRLLPNKSAPELETSLMTPAERSRAVAQARLLLLQTLDAIAEKAQADARGKQLFAGCRVEQSMNVKTWKDRERNHRDRRVGTIEQTAHYRSFMTNMERAEQERLNRPKPAPGGGQATAGVDGANEDGQPVAALVLHLRAKRDAQKAKRRKGSSGAKKRSDAGRDNKSTRKKRREPTNKSSSKSGGGRRERSRKKKGAKKGPLTSVTVTPTLLKHGNVAPADSKPVGVSNGTG